MVKHPLSDHTMNVSWALLSKKDPRFSCAGSAHSLAEAETLMDKWIVELAELLEVEPPDDISMSAVKA